MLKQFGLNSKLEITKEKITSRLGIVIYYELLKRPSIDYLADKFMPMPGSNIGYKPSSLIMLMLFSLEQAYRILKRIKNI